MPSESNPVSRSSRMRGLLDRLRGSLPGVAEPPAPALDDAFEAFGAAIEELRASEEHVQDTDEALLASRQQLEAERRRYHDLFELAPEPCLVTDAHGIIIEGNQAAAALLNIPVKFLRGKIPLVQVPLAERRAVREAVWAVSQGRAVAPFTVRFQPRHRPERAVEIAVSAYTPTPGRRPELLWLLRDVTDRAAPPADAARVAELTAALAAAEAERDRLRALTDASAAVLWELDPSTGRFTFVSRACEPLLGVPAEGWTAEPDFWLRRLHPEDRAMAAGLRSRQVEHRTDLEMEYRLVADDGRPVWVREVSRFAGAAADGPDRLHGVLLNITKRKRVERQLYAARSEAETRLRDVSLLKELCDRLSLSLEPREVLDEIAGSVAALLGAEISSVALFDADRAEIRIVASVGLGDEFLRSAARAPLGTTPCTLALAERRSIVVEDAQASEEFPLAREYARLGGYRGVFTTPLSNLAGDALGVLTAYFTEPHRPPERQQRLVELYAGQAGQLVANALRHSEVRAAEQHRDESLGALGLGLRDQIAAMTDSLRRFETAGADDGEILIQGLSRQTQHMARLVDDLLRVTQSGPNPPEPGAEPPPPAL